MCLSYWLQVSEGVEGSQQGSKLPLPFCCFPWAACMLECRQAGNFHSKDFPQSEQQIPAGAWEQLLAELSAYPLWEMLTTVSPLGQARGNLGFWSCGAQERQ